MQEYGNVESSPRTVLGWLAAAVASTGHVTPRPLLLTGGQYGPQCHGLPGKEWAIVGPYALRKGAWQFVD